MFLKGLIYSKPCRQDKNISWVHERGDICTFCTVMYKYRESDISADNSYLNLFEIHKLHISFKNYIAYSLQSDPVDAARP